MLVFMSSFTAGQTAESAEIFEIAVIFMTLNFSAPPVLQVKSDCRNLFMAGTSVWIEQW